MENQISIWLSQVMGLIVQFLQRLPSQHPVRLGVERKLQRLFGNESPDGLYLNRGDPEPRSPIKRHVGFGHIGSAQADR